jgi:hypothetical protein
MTTPLYPDNPERGATLLATLFYRLSGQKSRMVGPFLKSWIHFQRLRELLVRYNWQGYYKAYLKAQFEHAAYLKKPLYPSMLYSEHAQETFKRYIAYKKRRVGDHENYLAAEPELESTVLESYFEQGHFTLYHLCLNRGMEKEIVFQKFHHEFHPTFIAVSLWNQLEAGDFDGVPAKALHAYRRVRKHKNLEEVKRLYARYLDRELRRQKRRERLLGIAE